VLGTLAVLAALVAIILWVAARYRAVKQAQDTHSNSDRSNSIDSEPLEGGGEEMVVNVAAANPLLALPLLPPLSAQQARAVAGAVSGAVTTSVGSSRLLAERLTRTEALQALMSSYPPTGTGLLPQPAFVALCAALHEGMDEVPAAPVVVTAANPLAMARTNASTAVSTSSRTIGDVTTAAAPARSVAGSSRFLGAARSRSAALPPGATADLLQQAVTAATHIAVLTYFANDDDDDIGGRFGGGSRYKDPEEARVAFTSALRRSSQVIAAGLPGATTAAVATAVADSFLATATPTTLRRLTVVLGKEELWPEGSEALRSALYRRRATFLSVLDVEEVAAPPAPQRAGPVQEQSNDSRAAFAPTSRFAASRTGSSRFAARGGKPAAASAAAHEPAFPTAVACAAVGPAAATASASTATTTTAIARRPSFMAPSLVTAPASPKGSSTAAVPGPFRSPLRAAVTAGGATTPSTPAPASAAQPSTRVLSPPPRFSAAARGVATMDTYAPFANPLVRQGRTTSRTSIAVAATPTADPAAADTAAAASPVPGTVSRSLSSYRSPAAAAVMRGNPLRSPSSHALAAATATAPPSHAVSPPPPAIAAHLSTAVARSGLAAAV